MAKKKYLNLQGLTEVAEYVNEKLKKVTIMPSSPSLNDIVLYNGATSADYQQGGIYLYTIKEVYYGWSDGIDVYYTKAAAPEIGDTIYSDTTGTDSGFTVTAYDSVNEQVTFNSLVYDRDATSDVNINGWIYKGGTSVTLNGQDKTGDEANFYAPIAPGTSGQFLMSKGDGAAPEFASISPNGYSPSFIDNALVFTYGVLPEVEDNALVFDLDG